MKIIHYDYDNINFNIKFNNFITNIINTDETILLNEKFINFLSEAILKLKNNNNLIENKSDENLNNFLIQDIREKIIKTQEFIVQNYSEQTTTSKKELKLFMDNIKRIIDINENDENVDSEQVIKIVNFYKNFILQITTLYPNIIINAVDITDVYPHKYNEFSGHHILKISKAIEDYYAWTSKYYHNALLNSLLSHSKTKFKNIQSFITMLPIMINECKLNKYNIRTSKYLLINLTLSVFTIMISLTDESTVFDTTNVNDEHIFADYTEYTKKQILKNKLAMMINDNMMVFNAQNNSTNIKYDEISDVVFKVKTKERNIVVDRLTKMTDENRDVDNVFKTLKLGMYTKGDKAKVMGYDEQDYDADMDFREQLVDVEKNMYKQQMTENNDGNLDIFFNDFLNEQQADEYLETEAYNMEHLDEDYQDNYDEFGEYDYDD